MTTRYGIDAPYGAFGFILLAILIKHLTLSFHILPHNISGRKERERAIAEMARVLKPGGTLAVSDIKNTSQYRKLLEESGFQTRTYSFYYTFPFSKLIIAVRTPVGTRRSIC
ncbi:class I SAM-dependent methyltransferase [Bacillus sp. YAF8]|uniref:class I SAM-dependent methyltransferase n=2 Tax=Bacillaceae TaxID=186817 RepID=UPI003457CF38